MNKVAVASTNCFPLNLLYIVVNNMTIANLDISHTHTNIPTHILEPHKINAEIILNEILSINKKSYAYLSIR